MKICEKSIREKSIHEKRPCEKRLCEKSLWKSDQTTRDEAWSSQICVGHNNWKMCKTELAKCQVLWNWACQIPSVQVTAERLSELLKDVLACLIILRRPHFRCYDTVLVTGGVADNCCWCAAIYWSCLICWRYKLATCAIVTLHNLSTVDLFMLRDYRRIRKISPWPIRHYNTILATGAVVDR